MNKIKGVLQTRLTQRPFDFYLAAMLFITGLITIVSDEWPERLENNINQVFLGIVSGYLMIAGAVIMASLACKRRKYPILTLLGEMYGWLFVSAASVATTLMYCATLLGHEPKNPWTLTLIVSVWFGMAVASFMRFFDLFSVYRSTRR